MNILCSIPDKNYGQTQSAMHDNYPVRAGESCIIISIIITTIPFIIITSIINVLIKVTLNVTRCRGTSQSSQMLQVIVPDD